LPGKQGSALIGRVRAGLADACLLAAAVLLPAAGVRAGTFPRDEVITDPTPERFSVCYDFGCRSIAYVSFTAEEWAEIRVRFDAPAADAAAERERIREAIALFERITGERVGTKNDKGGTFGAAGEFQMDCVDETTNTTYYLRMLERQGLLRWHEVGEPAMRGWFLFGWPHMAATIVERRGAARWVVDSWFLDNGLPPFILPYELWRGGWNPPAEANPAGAR
jgi:hypothetical protein